MIALVLAVVALAMGLAAVIEAQGRSWAGWGVLALAALHLLT